MSRPAVNEVQEIEPGVSKYSNGTKYTKVRPVLKTFSGHKLTVRESKFIDEYIVNGNANAAAKAAGVHGVYELMQRPYIAEEIKHRMDEISSEKIADATEILEYFTKVMRGEETDQFGLEAPLSERTKAAMELAKRQIDFVQKAPVEQPDIKITLDWARDTQPRLARDLVNSENTDDDMK